jgi:hypothetical protein
MNKRHAQKISTTIPDNIIFDMLERAKNEVKDWTAPSKVNALMSRGYLWNMFTKDLKAPHYNIISPMVKYRLIHEFGELLPEEWQPPKRKKKTLPHKLVHQDPIFD